MIPSTPPRPRVRSIRLATLATAAGAALAAAGALTARLLAIAPDSAVRPAGVDQLVEVGVLAAGAVVAWWLASGLVTAVACAGTRAVGRRWSAGERFVAQHAPAVVQRGLALTIGAGVGLVSAVLPAVAQPADPPADLGWVATQVAVAPAEPVGEPAAGPGAGPVAGPVPGSPVPPPPAASPSVTVRVGDSLWVIAADHLAAGATDADIAAAWPTWHEANRAVVGDDPHRIQPGQILTAPATGSRS